MHTCIVIDDEPRARSLLQTMIEQYCPQLHVLALCDDLPTGVKAIRKYKPSLVFLDIEMTGHSGLEILDFFDPEEVQFRIIFTTAYSDYALQAFRFSAIDYLLKPIKHNLLIEAVERFVQNAKQTQLLHLKALQQNLEARTNWEEKRIALSTGHSLYFLQPKEIILVKGEAAYSDFHLSNGNKILVSKNLKHFEEQLTPLPMFFRCHKSYIINLQQVVRYIKADGGHLLLTGNLKALVSTEKVNELLELLDGLGGKVV